MLPASDTYSLGYQPLVIIVKQYASFTEIYRQKFQMINCCLGSNYLLKQTKQDKLKVMCENFTERNGGLSSSFFLSKSHVLSALKEFLRVTLFHHVWCGVDGDEDDK